MIVECIGNSINDISDKLTRNAFKRSTSEDCTFLEIGKYYQVFGISFMNSESIPWYLICEEDDDHYLVLKLGAFFKIIDGSIPPYWEFCPTSSNAGDCGFFPKKWASDPAFLEKLVDDNEDAIAYFLSLKNLLR